MQAVSLQHRAYVYFQLMRLNRPVGIALLWLPCLWGLILSYQGLPPFKEMLVFTLGAILMRSAGCVYNDLVDRDFDAHVFRTRSRPIAAGLVDTKEAWALILVLCLLAFGLLLTLPLKVILLGVFSVGLVAVYPWMKRITYWPQLFLGITFNWGILMGWFCNQSTLNMAVVGLYSAGIFWTLYYDTIYAFQDVQDDILIGVRSTARRFQHAPFPFLRLMAAMMILCLIFTGYAAKLGPLYFMVIFIVGWRFHHQLKHLNLEDSGQCASIFKENAVLGLVIMLGLLLGHGF
ncbi:MAG: 4-hydroxybenzoate octaprenyltransferase [Holosporales bacterium]